MHVRVSYKDFTVKDFKDVFEIKESSFCENISLCGNNYEIIQTFDKRDVHSIEVRP
jgi:hypothetical protein